jgi:hypothetical protein
MIKSGGKTEDAWPDLQTPNTPSAPGSKQPSARWRERYLQLLGPQKNNRKIL